MSIVIRSTHPVTSRPLTAPRAPGRSLYQARFSLGDSPSLVGMQTGTGDGLKLEIWQGDANGLAVSGGRVVPGAGAPIGFAGLPIAGVGGAMFMDVPVLPTSSGIYFDLFRGAIGTSPHFRLDIGATTAKLRQRYNPGSGHIFVDVGSAFSVSNGDRLGLRFAGGVLTAYRNGQPVAMGVPPATIPLNGFVGLAYANPAGFQLDNFDVEVY